MCKISSQIRCCSCTTKELNKAAHTWEILDKKLRRTAIGEIRPPATFSQQTEKYNNKTLLELLNNKMLFDKAMEEREADILVLHFNIQHDAANNSSITNDVDHKFYAFRFNGSEWESTEYDFFETAATSPKIKGKITGAFLEEQDSFIHK